MNKENGKCHNHIFPSYSLTSVSLFTKSTSTVTTTNNFSKNKNFILARMLIV